VLVDFREFLETNTRRKILKLIFFLLFGLEKKYKEKNFNELFFISLKKIEKLINYKY